MKPSKLYEALHALIGERVPLHIWGACGVGKSQIVAQVAADRKCEFLDIRAVQLDPVDLRGLPRISADRAELKEIPQVFTKRGRLPIERVVAFNSGSEFESGSLLRSRFVGLLGGPAVALAAQREVIPVILRVVLSEQFHEITSPPSSPHGSNSCVPPIESERNNNIVLQLSVDSNPVRACPCAMIQKSHAGGTLCAN